MTYIVKKTTLFALLFFYKRVKAFLEHICQIVFLKIKI